ncbi:MAG: phosphoribosylanthranilate isomerase [Candidatus Zixiibacteriota bacterium]
MMFKVKVCGITNSSDARLAVSLGADMIGVITHKGSPRFVSHQKIQAIMKEIPPTVDKVLVAVGNDVSPQARKAKRMGFDYLQWHGPLIKREVQFAKNLGVRIILAVSNPTASESRQAMATGASLILLDNASPRLHGGTGKPFDWSVRLPARLQNIVLAGGICADNVADGVRRFRPLVVDVNSGVESIPGKKSKSKLKRFFHVCDVIRYGSKA